MSEMNQQNGTPVPFFDFRQENGKWSIYDNRSGARAVLNGAEQAGLSLEEADDLTSVLNRVEYRHAAAKSARDG
jgi:hypothetical protein